MQSEHPANTRGQYLQVRFTSLRAAYFKDLAISPEEKRAVQSKEMQILFLSKPDETAGIDQIIEKFDALESRFGVKDYAAAVDLALFTLQTQILKAQK